MDGIAEFFERAGGGGGLLYGALCFLDNLRDLYLYWSECSGVGVGKCW